MKSHDSYAPLPTPSGNTGGLPALNDPWAGTLDPYAIPPGLQDDPIRLPDSSNHPPPGGPGGDPWTIDTLSKSDATS